MKIVFFDDFRLGIIDGSARGLPPPTNVSYQMNSRDTFSPMGPSMVTVDEIPDPQDLAVRLWVNGELKQSFSTSCRTGIPWSWSATVAAG